MKLLKAYIRPEKAEDVYKALKKQGFCCMTFVDCEGTGQNITDDQEHLSVNYPFAETNKMIRVEILIPKELVRQVVELIKQNSRTGYQGDGMIIVSPVDEVYKIRTDETGVHAI